jgi:hypothetical protein
MKKLALAAVVAACLASAAGAASRTVVVELFSGIP